MYHLCLGLVLTASAASAGIACSLLRRSEREDELHERAQPEVDEHEEGGDDHDHDEDHDRGDPGLAAAGPGDLARLRADLAEELDRRDAPLGRLVRRRGRASPWQYG